MEFKKLVRVYQKLGSTQKILEEREILADFFTECPEGVIGDVALLLMGKVFPSRSEKEIGIASKMMLEIINFATGVSKSELKEKWADTGDLGKTTEWAVKHKSQMTLEREKITVGKVLRNVRKIARVSGSGSQEEKKKLAADLITSASPKEGEYIVKIILGELRIGIGEGLIRDGLAKAFDISPEVIERAYFLTSDYSLVAKKAKKEGEKGLKAVEIEIGRPVKVMLYQKAKSIQDAFETVGRPAAIEPKYDGLRVQIHKKGEKILVFSRRQENITRQFPDIIKGAKEAVKADECILEGEAVGYDPETKDFIPFQKLSKRIKRKYDIKEMVEKFPTTTYLFDILYLNGKSMLNSKFKKRREKLEEVIDSVRWSIELVPQLITSDEEEANDFYQKQLKQDQEGVMFKNLNREYQPGSRVGYGLKLKPIMEPLDLAVVGAKWGEGARSDWLSSYLLACREKETGKFLAVGRMGTGLTEKQFEEMTKKMKPLILSQEGRKVEIRPEIVIEVGYEEIQKSPKYESGYALRFPRLKRIREDKPPEQTNSLEKVKELYEKQSG